ncbi:hypothetical protein GCM10027592_08570 [Spirosoma flavus]
MKTPTLSLFITMLTAQTLFAQNETWKIETAQLPNGGSYDGTVRIAKTGNTFNLDWKTTAGNYSGVGVMLNGKLFAGYGINSAYGVAVYKVNANGNQLEGVWTASQFNGQTGTETLTGQGGQYDVTGTNPDGGAYRGKLMMQKTGRTVQVQWNVANQTYNGVGFQSGDYLVIGYGFGQAFGVVEYAMRNDRANGRWAMGGGTDLGAENLVR